MKVALFGGSFDPVHSEHVRLAEAAITELGLDLLLVMPSYVAPHKSAGSVADGKKRLRMCQTAFSSLPNIEVSDFELLKGGTSYSYLTCRNFRERFPDAERYFLVGADMLENFFCWKEPDDILQNVTLVACRRGKEGVNDLHERFVARFHTDFLELSFCGEEVSSTEARVALAFGKEPRGIEKKVLEYIRREGLYRYNAAQALELETPERREHSYRVAQLAVKRAESLHVPFEQALLSAMLHDCGKYVAPNDPRLKGFTPPEGVPAPVLHQYTGAYLAEHLFGVEDGEILRAIMYHTSGREGMSTLEKLLYLADLLEEGRTFRGVEELRALFWEDLDACLARSLKEQVEYLKSTGKPVYPLTLQAERYYSAIENAKN